jgi:hypothetical protein
MDVSLRLFIIIIHLSLSHQRYIVQLLKKRCKMNYQKVLNWRWSCWDSKTHSHNLIESLKGDYLRRLKYVRPAFIEFCGVRSGQPGRCAGRKRSMEYPTQSPGFTELDFYLLGDYKEHCARQKPRTFQDLRCEIEISCADIPPSRMREVYQSVFTSSSTDH